MFAKKRTQHQSIDPELLSEIEQVKQQMDWCCVRFLANICIPPCKNVDLYF